MEAQDGHSQLDRELLHLRRLNATVERVIAAVDASSDNTKSVDATVVNADKLLDLYIRVLGRADAAQRLVLDPSWRGASDDVTRMDSELRRTEIEEEEGRLQKEALLQQQQQQILLLQQQQSNAALAAAQAASVASIDASSGGATARPSSGPASGVRGGGVGTRGRGKARSTVSSGRGGGTGTTTTAPTHRSSIAPPGFTRQAASAGAPTAAAAAAASGTGPNTRGRGAPVVRGTRASRGRQVMAGRSASGEQS